MWYLRGIKNDRANFFENSANFSRISEEIRRFQLNLPTILVYFLLVVKNKEKR
jgi:hypothetical protein